MKRRPRNLSLFKLQFTEKEQKIKHKVIFLDNVLSVVTILAIIMGVIHWRHHFMLTTIDFGFATVNLALLYYLHKHKEKIEWISTVALAFAFVIFYFVYLFAPHNALRLSLFFLLSASILFLKGRALGLVCTLFILFSIALGNLILPFYTAYSFFEIAYMSINLIVFFFIINNYELIKEEQTEHLEHLNLNLEKKVKERTKALQILNETLEESEERFRSAFDFAAIGMALVSLSGQWLKVNKSLCKILGYTEQELLNINFQQITHPDDLETDLSHVQELLDGKIINYQMEKRYICSDGHIVWILLNVSLLRDANTTPLYFISQMQNIDTQKNAEQKLKHMAYHDVLTGLANRMELDHSFELFLAYTQRHNTKIAVMYMDLDYFKAANDTFGHCVGDLLLTEIASRLKNCARSTDIVGRLGGDEFLIILSDITNQNDVQKIVAHLVATLIKPIKTDHHEISMTASIGISMYPQDGVDLNTLIKRADIALYDVKQAGRNNFKFYADCADASLHSMYWR